MLAKIKNLVFKMWFDKSKKNEITAEYIQIALDKVVHYIDFKIDQRFQIDDLLMLSRQQSTSLHKLLGWDNINISIQTKKPVAFDSDDHLHPWGTSQDNSVNVKFNQAIYKVIPIHKLKVLDIGCSGGGFVKSINDSGALAVGIEGSDYSKIRKRAEWATIPDRLFTADATQEFQIKIHEENALFNLITAWEVLEHIKVEDLPMIFNNINRHLEKYGIVIFSISPNDDIIDGVNLHKTIKPFDWWENKIKEFGFIHHPDAIKYFMPNKWIRYEDNAPGSFHLLLTRRDEQNIVQKIIELTGINNQSETLINPKGYPF